ncbi:MAG: MazG family protein [Actinomycetia bacterium]|nr:MazG family protein [Actinomycetes bacterium]
MREPASGSGVVSIVGLGPAGTDLLLPAARTALTAAAARFVRTSRHPAVQQLEAEGIGFESFDAVYDAAPSLADAYGTIAGTVVAAANRVGHVVYAVPGNPAVAEQSVALLQEAAGRGEVEVRVVPGLSFADLAWARLGIDPMGGARVVDARAFAAGAAGLGGAMLVAQCDSQFVLSDVKLALLEVLQADHPVVGLQRLGLPDELVTHLELVDLDRSLEPDHLTAVFVDVGGARVGAEFVRLVELAERLRGPGGCPWDAEQTHASLAKYLIEEAYETLEAVERLPPDAPPADVDPELDALLADELGDLLYQVVFHSILAGERGAFSIADVARGIHDKLVRRHPDVFGVDAPGSAAEVLQTWEQIKRAEKGGRSLVAGITPGLPALLFADKLLSKAKTAGITDAVAPEALPAVQAAMAAFTAEHAEEGDDTDTLLIGSMLGAVVLVARSRGVDAEGALRAWVQDLIRRFRSFEVIADEEGVDVTTLDHVRAAELWRRAGGVRSDPA